MFLTYSLKSTRIAVVASVCALSFIASPVFSQQTPNDKSSLADQQKTHNETNEKSKTNDQCQGRQSCGPQDAQDIYYSLPSYDRTMRNVYIVPIPGQAQEKKNCEGGNCPTQGQQGEFNKTQGQAPETPLTNAGANKIMGEWANFQTELQNSPQMQAKKATAGMQSQAQGAAESGAKGSCDALEQVVAILFSPTATLNVANEAVGTPGTTLTPFRPISQAIWMVQRMFHSVYIPMALLLLLPGALILQMKCVVHSGINHGSDEDTASPFQGILRAIIAVFLIPCTQLIISYAIDIGNSMTHEVQGATKVMALVAWAKQSFGEDMKPTNGAATASRTAKGSQMMKAVWNNVNMTLCYGLLILNAFQIALMCYLMCMGPIAAAFYVWPTGVGKLFKPVFANWVDAVINLAMWKFWWCVIVLCMITRINVMTFAEINPEWEALMFTCFLVMMSYVPFMPFDMRPGDMVDKLLAKAQELQKSSGQKAAG